MATFNEDFTGQNLKRLRKAVQLTQDELATFLGISGKTVQNVEKNIEASVDFNFPSFERFFGYSRDEISKELISIPDDYRAQIQEKHAANESYTLKLNKIPTIPFALKTMIIEGGLDSPKTITQIRKYFAKRKWSWAINSISDAIKENKEALGIKTGKIEGDKRGLYYWVNKS